MWEFLDNDRDAGMIFLECFDPLVINLTAAKPSMPDDLDALLLTESALDTLAALLLLAPSLPPDTLLASTAGVATTLPRWLQAFRAPRILCAYDADQAGDQAADALRRNVPNCSRLRPAGAKDWNDLLRRSRPR